MMTPDKDFGQLVSDKVRMYRPGRGRNPAEIWGPEEVCAKFGLNRTDQVIDYLGLMGDASDNIPGVPGVGAKTAAKLLCEFDSIDGLYKNTDKLNGKMKEKVEANHDLAILSRKLATIELNIDAEINIGGMIRQELDETLLRNILEDLEFRSLLNKLISKPTISSVVTTTPEEPKKESTAESGGQLDMFSTSAPDPNPTPFPEAHKEVVLKSIKANDKYHLIRNDSELNDLISKLEKEKGWGFHVITDGFNPMTDKLLGVAFSLDSGHSSYVHLSGFSNNPLGKLKPLLEDSSKKITATNYKFAIKVLAMHGVKLSPNIFDCMVAHYLLDPDQTHKLKDLAQIFLGFNAISLEGLVGKGKNRKTLGEIDISTLQHYACESADLVIQLKNIFIGEIEKSGLTKLLEDVEFPLISILADMELTGVKIDEKMLEEYNVDLSGQLDDLQSKIIKEAGVEFNIDSPKQLGSILFETLIITDKTKKTKTGQYQTGEDVLKKLSDKHPIVPLVIEYRKLKKLKSTYVEPLPKLIHPKTGRIHTSYMQTVASTGRLSSKDPNLQNIPIRTEAGRQIRKAFIPKDSNNILLGADYSQIELRVAASMSKDPGLCDAFVNNQDVHSATASKVFEVNLEDVTSEQRSQAKAVNFGILYGQGVFGLAEELGIKRQRAKEIIASYNEQFNTLGAFTKSCIEQAREKEYAETIMGRRRKLPGINSNNGMVKAFAERNAVNAPIQGSAADIIKVAMVKLYNELEKGNWKAKMIMQVHDELVLDVPKDELEALKPILKKCMENAVEINIPLIVDMNSGEDWLAAH